MYLRQNITVLLINKKLKNYNIWAMKIKIGECKTKTVVVFVFYSSHKIPPSNSLFSPKYKDSGVDSRHLSGWRGMTFSQDLSLLTLLSTFLVWLTSKKSRFLWWVEVTREAPDIWGAAGWAGGLLAVHWTLAEILSRISLTGHFNLFKK